MVDIEITADMNVRRCIVDKDFVNLISNLVNDGTSISLGALEGEYERGGFKKS